MKNEIQKALMQISSFFRFC